MKNGPEDQLSSLSALAGGEDRGLRTFPGRSPEEDARGPHRSARSLALWRVRGEVGSEGYKVEVTCRLLTLLQSSD